MPRWTTMADTVGVSYKREISRAHQRGCLLRGTVEHPVPPVTGQQQLPPELSWVLPVPAVDASAGLAD